LSRDVRQATAGCASLTSAFGLLRHHLLMGRLQPVAHTWAGSTLRFQAEMDFAQLVHQLGPHGRAAVAEQLGANAAFVRNRQIFVTLGSHLREDRQQLDAMFGQRIDALLLCG
jgi:hypothetical protein